MRIKNYEVYRKFSTGGYIVKVEIARKDIFKTIRTLLKAYFKRQAIVIEAEVSDDDMVHRFAN